MTASTATTGTLYVALELGCDKWVLASATQAGKKGDIEFCATWHLRRKPVCRILRTT
jgi:hypothetical protein